MRWLSKEKWRPRLATVVVAILIVVMAADAVRAAGIAPERLGT
ncbi:hypothetical protein [Mesorhizobium sp. M00.F.Ca.ET.217.01.1.1]|nr:hypothetical protein [Mesorhizobium sp. M00.F.Ca.ET.217.01.1.1]